MKSMGFTKTTEPKKYSIDDLKGIKSLYKSKLKDLQNGN